MFGIYFLVHGQSKPPHAAEMMNLCMKFVEWYAKQVSDQLKWGVRIENVIVDLKTSNAKPIHANWLLSVFDEISKDKHCVIEGFELASISEVLSDTRPVLLKMC
ncbi:hypothetical protein KUTeg_024260 [Tegillarca granosa]|uniref:Uncharacterized protein n=1 Tax=Tegillarca granosa TaxID=220873 RepID=A0ABQ9DXD7_TEGGR|nr:hypothetical protein KUTeg_024260 [Tegillarca granosa]